MARGDRARLYRMGRRTEIFLGEGPTLQRRTYASWTPCASVSRLCARASAYEKVCGLGNRKNCCDRRNSRHSRHVAFHAGTPRRARDSRLHAGGAGSETFAVAHRQHCQGRLHRAQPAGLAEPRSGRRWNTRGSARNALALGGDQGREDQELPGGGPFHLECQPSRPGRSPRSVRGFAAAHAAGATRGATGSFADRALVRSVHGLRMPRIRLFRPEDRCGKNPVKTALIGGIGNVLLGDDGVGPYVLHLLESQYTFGDNVRLVDLGTPALDLTHQIVGLDAVILVDSVTSDDPPGTITLYRKEDIVREVPTERLDPHSPALSECLLTAEMLGASPKQVLLVGIAGKTYEPGNPLSAAVQGSVAKAIQAVLEELQRLGFEYQKRLLPNEPGIWWGENSGV